MGALNSPVIQNAAGAPRNSLEAAAGGGVSPATGLQTTARLPASMNVRVKVEM